MDSSKIYQSMTKYRLALFGLAVIWIFFRHTFYYNQILYSIFSPIVQIGDCGVDIFMFLSGFGLYFSYGKCKSKLEFYKKRVLRILPMVIFLLAVFAIFADVVQGKNPTTIIRPGYWFISIYANYWFIGAILLFYTLFPFIYSCVKKKARLFTIISVILSLAGIYCIHFCNVAALGQLVLYFARFPVFVLGVVFAHHQNLLSYKKTLVLFCLFSVPLLFFLPKDYQRMMYFSLALFVSIILPQYFHRIPSIVLDLLSKIGKVSLEFYLIHVFLFEMGIIDYLSTSLSINIYVSVALSFCIVLVCSQLSSLCVSKVIMRWNR